jgi:hypothetical protein
MGTSPVLFLVFVDCSCLVRQSILGVVNDLTHFFGTEETNFSLRLIEWKHQV